MQDSSIRPNFQITRAWAKNYRSISEAEIELDPLTVLVGPNASGKSNWLDVLRFIKDALRFDLEVAISQRQGIEAICHSNSRAEQPHIGVGIAATVRSRHTDRDYAYIRYGFALTQKKEGMYSVSQEYGIISDGDEDSPVFGFSIQDDHIEFSKNPAPLDLEAMLRLKDSDDLEITDLALPALVRVARRRALRDHEQDDYLSPLVSDVFRQLHRNLTTARFYHIFPNTIKGPQRPGSTYLLDEDASNLASTIWEIKREFPLTMVRIREALSLLVPGVSDLEVNPVGGYLAVRLKHGSGPRANWFDLSQESDGTVRLLALLVALNQRRLLPLIGIEEPELTVHPGSLAVLADLINEAALRSQVIVTTHSPDFVDCITEYKAVDSLRIVELVDGATNIASVAKAQVEAVRERLFSPGELHRMGELRLSQRI